jgi:hypothetical protein
MEEKSKGKRQKWPAANQKANIKRQKAKVYSEAKPVLIQKLSQPPKGKGKENKCRPFAFCSLPFAF